METNVYLMEYGPNWATDYHHFDKFRWTGRWKIETKIERYRRPPGYTDADRDNIIVDRTDTLYLERRFGIFPFCYLFPKTWECESNFEIREEETFISECGDVEELI